MINKVKTIMSDILSIPLENITDEASPDNIEEWDSLNQMNLIIALEQEFEIEFTDDQIIQMLDLKSIVNVLSEIVN